MLIVAATIIFNEVDFVLGVGVGEWAAVTPSTMASLFPVVTHIEWHHLVDVVAETILQVADISRGKVVAEIWLLDTRTNIRGRALLRPVLTATFSSLTTNFTRGNEGQERGRGMLRGGPTNILLRSEIPEFVDKLVELKLLPFKLENLALEVINETRDE